MQRSLNLLAILLVLPTGPSCKGGGTVDLSIDLQTDLVPEVEFVRIRTVLLGDELSVETDAIAGFPFEEGQRVAEFEGLSARRIRRGRVSLLRADGTLLVAREFVFPHREDFAASVLIDRGCVGADCPGNACQGGQCVDPECISGTDPACDRTCMVDTDCPEMAACAQPRCAGVCVYLDRGTCDSDEYCSPERGCLARPDRPDAGLEDAGRDAGRDAGLDAGRDSGVDVGVDSGFDAGSDAGFDAGVDAGSVGTVVEVSASTGAHTCARTNMGRVYCWGANGSGQLGDGTNTPRSSPTLIAGLTNVTQIATGENHSCALLSSGQVRCWGQNNRGQLGDGTTTPRNTPTPVSTITNATQIDTRYWHACARLSDGTARCWGYNTLSAVGDGTFATPVTTPTQVVDVTGFTSVMAGGRHSCGVRSSTDVWCWGGKNCGELAVPIGGGASEMRPVASNFTSVRELQGGFGFTCNFNGLRRIECAGCGSEGELGGGMTLASTSIPMPVVDDGTGMPINSVQGFSIGLSHGCLLDFMDRAYCWGANGAGRLGDGTTTMRTGAVRVMSLGAVDQISAGGAHTCAVLSGGGVRCWGRGGSGELGDGRSMDSSTPVVVSGL